MTPPNDHSRDYRTTFYLSAWIWSLMAIALAICYFLAPESEVEVGTSMIFGLVGWPVYILAIAQFMIAFQMSTSKLLAINILNSVVAAITPPLLHGIYFGF